LVEQKKKGCLVPRALASAIGEDHGVHNNRAVRKTAPEVASCHCAMGLGPGREDFPSIAFFLKGTNRDF
jgi:hypothetical protein